MSTPLTEEILTDIELFGESAQKFIDKPENSGKVYPLYLLIKRLNKELSKNVRKKK